jgi:hypothetical protein
LVIILGLFEEFTKTKFNNKISSEQVRSRWQKLRSYYSVILKNKSTTDKECIKWKHLQSMNFMKECIRGRSNTKAGDDDDEQLQYDEDGYLRLPDSNMSMTIKEETVSLGNSAIQESFNPLKYCAVGIQNSTMLDDSHDGEDQDDQEDEPVQQEPMDVYEQQHDNSGGEFEKRKRGRPRRSFPVIKLEKRKRGRPKGYSPLAKYNMLTPYMPQPPKKFHHYPQQASTSYQPPPLHAAPSEEEDEEEQHLGPLVPETTITPITNNQPATSTTTDVQGLKEADHMAHILTSMLHRIENPIERTEIFIKMLQLCKDGLQKN